MGENAEKPPVSREPCYPCMAHLSTRGTFYDVGYNVGLNFSDKIKRYIAESDYIQHDILPFYDTQAGRDYLDESLRVNEACFPHYVREVRGLADGAGLPFEQVFALQVLERASLESMTSRHNKCNNIGEPTGTTESRGDNFGCSTLIINRPDQKLILHNEDSDAAVKPFGYIVTADIQEDGMKEAFTSFCYPGTLPGWAYSFNQHGLVVTINALAPDHVVPNAPGRMFVTRALLGARDVEDACRILQNESYGMAYGFCANIATAKGDMVVIEVGPGKPCAQLHVQRVEEEKDPDKPSHYWHFNRYEDLKVPEVPGRKSSAQRAARAAQLPPPRTLQDGLVAMGDTKDALFPIFRDSRPPDACMTVGTVVFDVMKREMLVYQDNPGAAGNKPFLRQPIYS